MTPNDPVVDAAARAVLDGVPVDWGGLESSADLGTRALAEQLKVLSTVALVHRAGTAVDEPPRRQTSLPGPREPISRWGPLELREKVGSGAFGDVYRAWDARLDREVALKLMPAGPMLDAGSSPIIREGRLLARVRHQNVATIYGAELIDGQVGLWMEFVQGQTLEELLRSGHQFSLSEVVEIGIGLCHAVSAVHAAGLLHRDIKAQNVMRADDGRVVLMDFGTGQDRAEDGATAAGTPLYLAPEIFRGEPATPASDVYSVGVVLYHLLTGAYPVTAKSIQDLRRAHDTNDRKEIQERRPELPAAIARVVGQALAPDPAGRYATADALAADLLPFRRVSQKKRWVAGALAAAVVLMASWAGWSASGPAGFFNQRMRASSGGAAVGAVAGLAPTEMPVIAVRPFRNLSSEPDSDLVVDGFTYELIRSLAVIDGLEVKSATSSFALKGKEHSLADIGRQLGVNLVLEGSVFESNGQLRVEAQLVHVANDTPLWTERFDRKVTDILAVDDEISLRVVNRLRLALGRGQRRYDLDPETSELYLKARTLSERRGVQNNERAADLFQQAIDRDPAFAPAYAGLAAAYTYMSQDLPDMQGLSFERALALMRPAALKAIELDPLLAEAHAAMGLLYSREFAWEAAQQSFRQAIDLNPALTQIYTAYSLTTLLPLGRFQQDELLLGEAFRRDPLSLDVRRQLAIDHIYTGRYEDAIRQLEYIQDVDPGYPYLPVILARARTFAGRLDEAMPYWDSVNSEIGSQHWLSYAYVRAGRRAEVERFLPQHTSSFRLAIIYTALGQKDRALEALAQAADEAPHRVVRLLVYPELASLRDDPRFEAIRAKFHLP